MCNLCGPEAFYAQLFMTHPTLTVRSFEVVPVSVPLIHPVRTASGDVTHAPLLLIDLHTEQGVTGRAYLFTYTALALKPVADLVHGLGERLTGKEVSPFDIARELGVALRLLGDTGLTGMALAGIDMAAWDALARAAGMPLARLLGGSLRPVPSYFSRGMDGAKRGSELAEECLKQGFKAMKVKIGYPTLKEDLIVVREVQSVLGQEALLAVDYNQSLSVPEAIRRSRALDEFELAWIEEPTRYGDVAGHAKIAREICTPIMIGENWSGVQEMAASIGAGASDLVMPDLMKIGGVSGWLRAAATAATAGLPMSSHIFQEVSAQVMTVTPTAHWLEYLDLAAPVLEAPLRIEGGMAILGDEPGSGLSWDREAVARYRVS
jgi:mandelate racemase